MDTMQGGSIVDVNLTIFWAIRTCVQMGGWTAAEARMFVDPGDGANAAFDCTSAIN